MGRLFAAGLAACCLLVATAVPVSAQGEVEQIEVAVERVLDEVAVLAWAGAFEPNGVVDIVMSFYAIDFADQGDLLDSLDDAENDGDLWLSVLEGDGLALSGPVISTLAYSPDEVEDAVLQGDTGFLSPTPWLDALVDLLRRRGQAPAGPRSPGDHQLIVEFMDDFARTGEFFLSDYEELETAAPAAAANAVPAVPASAAEQPAGGEPSSSPPFAAIGGGVAGVALLIGYLLFRRRKPSAATVAAATEKPQSNGLVEVLETSRRMTAALDADEIRRIAVTDAVRMTGAEAGAMLVHTDQGLRFTQVTHSGLFDPGVVTSGALVRVIETGQAAQLVTVDDPALERLPIAVAAAPVVAHGGVVGSLVVLRAATEPFGTEAAKALELLTPVTGSALAAAATHNTAVTAADIDGLTNLHNRRRMDRDLDALSNDDVVGFAMIDVDHFKHFNDANGHGAGDVALQAVAQAAAAAARHDDVVYRYGGEEFSVLLRNCTVEDAVAVMERIRASIEALSIPGAENQPSGSLTISVGVAIGSGADAPTLSKHADEALYEAKETGRNRIVVHGA